MKCSKLSSKFTLIELLMVIVVIIILLAIILPSTQTVRGKSKKSVCMSNLRQIGMGLRMYADENNELYPHCTRRPSEPPQDEEHLPGISQTLKPYLKDRKIFLCPADTGEYYFRNDGSSYEWNSVIYNGWKAGRKPVETEVKIPEIPVMTDYDGFHSKRDSKTSKNYLYPDGKVSGELLK